MPCGCKDTADASQTLAEQGVWELCEGRRICLGPGKVLGHDMQLSFPAQGRVGEHSMNTLGVRPSSLTQNMKPGSEEAQVDGGGSLYSTPRAV